MELEWDIVEAGMSVADAPPSFKKRQAIAVLGEMERLVRKARHLLEELEESNEEDE